jgi:hypothetical protein
MVDEFSDTNRWGYNGAEIATASNKIKVEMN